MKTQTENSTAKHTPTPWQSEVPPSSLLTCRWIMANGNTIALIGHKDFTCGQSEDLANAEFICQAVNQHDTLIAQRDALKSALEAIMPILGQAWKEIAQKALALCEPHENT